MILYNSENNIRDIRPFCRMLSFVTAVLWSMSLNYQLLLKSPPLTLLAGSAPAFTHFCNDFFKKILYNLKVWGLKDNTSVFGSKCFIEIET